MSTHNCHRKIKGGDRNNYPGRFRKFWVESTTEKVFRKKPKGSPFVGEGGD